MTTLNLPNDWKAMQAFLFIVLIPVAAKLFCASRSIFWRCIWWLSYAILN